MASKHIKAILCFSPRAFTSSTFCFLPGKEAFAFEFKWSELSNKKAASILKELEGKTKIIPKKLAGLQLGLVAKKIEGKQKLRAEGFLAFDLDDF